MKKTLFSVALCLAALCASAQSYEVRTLTFEDADYRGSGNVVGEMNWSSLIDDAEYNGTLLYGDGKDTYMWYDEGNTELVWDGLQGIEFWSGGAAISNYYLEDFSQADYTRQLSIPLAASSNQFLVVFNSVNLLGYPSFTNCTPFYFSDDKARVIESVDVINTAYALNSLTNGDGFAPAATDESQFVVHFEGTHEDGTTSEVTFLLADGRNFIEDWTSVDLTPLGMVKSLRTYVTGSADLEGDWGLNTPGYVALDNIKVRFENEIGTGVATFEDITDITEPVDGHISVGTEDDDDREFFVSGNYAFNSGCMSDWDYWYWFGYASRTETKYDDLDDQWNNVVGGGYDGSATYGVAFAAEFNGPCYVTLLTEPAVVPGFYITNSSYAYNSLTGGDSFAKKFELGDWFLLTITGYDANDQVTGTKEYYLADLRSAKTAYIINDWRYVDLSGLGEVAKLGFELTSSDVGAYGMNTPAYFCFDNFGAEGTEVLPDKNVDIPMTVATFENITVPAEGHMSVSTEEDDERTSFESGTFEFATGCMSDWDYWYWFGYANSTETKYETLDDQWNNIVGGGYNGSANYGVAFAAAFNGPCYVTLLTEPAVVPGFYITNSSYAYDSMTNGDGFAKKFELGDWFLLTITGYDANDQVTGTKEYYLADMRSAKTAYIINDWRYVDLSGLGEVAKLGFELTSSDVGAYGMNTPAYFCFDNFGATGTEVLPENNVAFVSSMGYATYVTKQDVDFSKSAVEAFAVTESGNSGYVYKEAITEAPAGEAVLLKGEEGAYVLPAAATTPAAPAGNLLKPALTDVTCDGAQYILANGTKGVGFYKAKAGTTIAAGKGYLEFVGSPVKAFLFEGDDATGIESFEGFNGSDASEGIYNLAGQRMGKAQRGINIINGKKILK